MFLYKLNTYYDTQILFIYRVRHCIGGCCPLVTLYTNTLQRYVFTKHTMQADQAFYRSNKHPCG